MEDVPDVLRLVRGQITRVSGRHVAIGADRDFDAQGRRCRRVVVLIAEVALIGAILALLLPVARIRVVATGRKLLFE